MEVATAIIPLNGYAGKKSYSTTIMLVESIRLEKQSVKCDNKK
jgi:hypothetical protein